MAGATEMLGNAVNGTTFDTLSAARELEAAGADRALAEAIAKTVRDGQGDLATKSDVAAVHSRIDTLHSRIGTLQWVVGIQSAITLATFAIVAARLL